MKFIVLLLCMSYYFVAHAQFSNIKKGDVLEINGVKGIVFSIDENGEHGTMMSIQVLRGKKNAFGSQSKYAKALPLNSKTDGKKNTEDVFKYIKEHDLNWKEFPAFNWCRSLGEGWYIPAVSQLEIFINYWLGNENELDWDEDNEEDYKIDENIPQPKLINKIMLEAGGVPFLNGVYTSSKNEKGKIYIYAYNRPKNWWKFYTRDPMNLDIYTVGRAFYDF